MIERYTTKEMARLWSEENRLSVMLDVELAVCRAWCGLGRIPEDALRDILAGARFSVERVREIESEVQHDVVAFVSAVAENVGENGRYLHLGLTSSDVLDTASSLMLRDSLDCIGAAARELDAAALDLARRYRYLPCVGRTHGIHAEPMTFGMKFGSWAWELRRDLDRLLDARRGVAVGAISGAVGTYSSIDPRVEAYVCGHLGLDFDPLSTQVISRDHHAYLAGVLATMAATCERIATELRNLQRTDTLEVEEPFRKGQKGSSAMPHKRNPITMEKVCGLSRVVKANAQVAFDNVALWHERDISHSSAERVAQADSLIALDHMLQCLIRVVDGLVLYRERMLANLDRTRGLIYSSKVLLALVDTGITREDAYKIVQANAMETWREVQRCSGGTSFREKLEDDPQCTLPPEQLDRIFDPHSFLGRVDVVFDRLEQLSFE